MKRTLIDLAQDVASLITVLATIIAVTVIALAAAPLPLPV